MTNLTTKDKKWLLTQLRFDKASPRMRARIGHELDKREAPNTSEEK